jgi:hypothetical protein
VRNPAACFKTLGVTREKYASMFYPLVESSLPEDIIFAWERSRNSKTEPIEHNNILTSLFTFLRLEVESEERYELASSGFGYRYDSKCSTSTADKTPTAACIFSCDARDSDRVACLWCDKTSHISLECFNAKRLTLDAYRKLVKQKGRCYLCLKLGHNAKCVKVLSNVLSSISAI